MAVRIEYILIMVFALLIAAVFGFTPTSRAAISGKAEKEVQFENFQLFNLKENDSNQKIYASKATKYNKYIKFTNVNVTDDLGHTIFSDTARYEDDVLHMKKNVKVSRDDGIDFLTESLNYDLTKKLITTSEPFVLEVNRTIIRGDKLVFEVENKIISAYNVDASIWFEENK